MIKIFDNFLNSTYAEAISRDVLSVLHFHYNKKTSQYLEGGPLFSDAHTFDYGHFVCPLFNRENTGGMFPCAWYFGELKPIIYNIQDAIPELKIRDVNRVKVNIMKRESSAPEFHYNIPHQDSPQNGDYTAIYYCDDSDGDTFLFNEFYSDSTPAPDKLTIHTRVTPKKNRLVVFESTRYHASSTPRISDERVVINFTFSTEETYRNHGK